MKEPPYSKLLPVAIMAHNEAKVIARAIKSCFDQICPQGYSIFVIVVANGCEDDTEQIVLSMKKQYKDRLILISMREKGKTKALNRSISYLNDMAKRHDNLPFVVYLDADCEFVGNDVLISFINRFEDIPRLCAVGACNVPQFKCNPKTNLISGMYFATNELSQLLQENAISGMAYCIKLDILSKLKFPEIQMADDMYICLKLDGWMFRDKAIKVSFAIPDNLSIELRKRIRQEIANLRFFAYNRHLLETEKHTALFSTPLDDKYRWKGFNNREVYYSFLRIKGIRNKILICLSILIRLLAKFVAERKLKNIEVNPETDFWQVER
jgi:glycosyltransferase involved in cell wall biosynthesis